MSHDMSGYFAAFVASWQTNNLVAAMTTDQTSASTTSSSLDTEAAVEIETCADVLVQFLYGKLGKYTLDTSFLCIPV